MTDFHGQRVGERDDRGAEQGLHQPDEHELPAGDRIQDREERRVACGGERVPGAEVAKKKVRRPKFVDPHV
jgi:hypothetical protein